MKFQTPHIKHRLVLRRRFQWPAWLKCRYLVWDEDGTASGWIHLPVVHDGEWNLPSSALPNDCHFQANDTTATHLSIAFPGGDWKTRIEENPNWKGTA
jgi:hypothetical protein